MSCSEQRVEIAQSILGQEIIVDSSRGGSGCIGEAFEKHWGVDTNNRAEADSPEHGELKSKAIDANHRDTLLTLAPDKGGRTVRQMVELEGEDCPHTGRRKLSLTFHGCNGRFNSRGFGAVLTENQERIDLVHESGRPINCYYSVDRIYKRVKAKLPKLVHGLHAKTDAGAVFQEMRFYEQLKSKEGFVHLLKNGQIVIEMTAYFYAPNERMGRNGQRCLRNRGVKFRTHDVASLYDAPPEVLTASNRDI